MEELSLPETQKKWHGTLKAYLIGFSTCILLTIVSFALAFTKPLTGQYLSHVLVILALIQAVVQLLFFMHVGQEAKPKWETMVFYSMVTTLLIIAVGTLWIIYDLNNRTMANMASMDMSHD